LFLYQQVEDFKTKDRTMDFQSMKLPQLRKLAQAENVEGRNGMTKAELAEALEYTGAADKLRDSEIIEKAIEGTKAQIEDIRRRIHRSMGMVGPHIESGEKSRVEAEEMIASMQRSIDRMSVYVIN
jgi:hypothetical protein